MAVQARSNQLVLGLTAPPVPRLRGGVGDKVFLLQGLNGPNVAQERSALLGNRAASGQEPCEGRVPDHLEQGGFQEGLDGFGAAAQSAAAAELAMQRSVLTGPDLAWR